MCKLVTGFRTKKSVNLFQDETVLTANLNELEKELKNLENDLAL
jgi:hypothetical protein